jgi:hypothetical protein
MTNTASTYGIPAFLFRSEALPYSVLNGFTILDEPEGTDFDVPIRLNPSPRPAAIPVL